MARLVFLLIIPFFAAGVVADAPPRTEGAFPGANGKIAYSSNQVPPLGIYVMNPDGSNKARLSDGQYPAWSPDGSMIAFEAFDDIYVMNADGSGKTNLTNGAGLDTWPAWSPDGSKIAFTSSRDSGPEIYVMNADGTDVTNLTNDPAEDYEPAWSPDGSKIAFWTDRNPPPPFPPPPGTPINYEIYLMNADGSGQENLTNDPTGDSNADWSPDGSRLVFVKLQGDNFEIYVMNADGSSQTPLTNDPAFDYHPTWSPDGSRVAFERSRDIYVMNSDGTGLTNLTNSGAQDTSPAWQPIPGIGGIAELPDVARAALEAQPASDASGALFVNIAVAIAVSGVGLSGAAWYARRRR